MEGKKIGFWEAVSIGIGGMIGGGIFAVLGLTVLLARGAAPIAFLIAGLIALVTAYSYAKLSVRFPSEGGTIEFIVRAFGPGVFSAWLNTLLLASYVIMLSLYSYAFGSYGAVLIAGVENLVLKKVLTAFVIVFFTFLNLLGAYIVGKAEDIMVAFKVFILLFFSALGLLNVDLGRLSPSTYPSVFNILTGGLIIFLAYEGFELIANTARDVENPEKILPKAFYTAVLFVMFVYVLVAFVAVGNLPYDEVVKAKDYVLAEAARPFLGEWGFVLIGVAALISTASAINATLYGTARISYLVAKYGQLPKIFEKKIWRGSYEGLIILSLLTLFAALTFNLKNISVAGSLGFLIVFGAVNVSNWKLSEYTGANPLISAVGAVACVFSAFVLVLHNLKVSPDSLKSSFIMIGATLVFELLYRTLTGKRLSEFIDWKLREREEFLKNLDFYLERLKAVIKERLSDAEIVISERGSGKSVSMVDVSVATGKDIEDPEQEEAKIKEKAGIKAHHPVRISFVKKAK